MGMLIQEKQQSILKSQNVHLEDGQTTEKSNFVSLQEDTGGIKSQTVKIKKLQVEKNTYIPESVLLSKKKILKDKLPISKTFTQPTLSFQTYHPVLTTKERVLKPFWDRYSLEMSMKLWSTQEIDLPGLELSYLNSSLNSLVPQSSMLTSMNNDTLQLMNLPKIYFQSSHSSLQNTTVQENIKYTKKIRFYPSQKLREYLKLTSDSCRYIYNKCVAYDKERYKKRKEELKELSKNGCLKCKEEIKEESYFCHKHHKEKIPWNLKFLSPISLRKEIMRSNKQIPETDPEFWMVKSPYNSRSITIRNYTEARKSCLSNLKAGHIKYFNTGFKRKKGNQVFPVDKDTLNKNKLEIFPTTSKKYNYDGKFFLRSKEKKWWDNCINNMNSDFKILTEKPGRYYFLFTLEKQKEKFEPEFEVVSLDPGVRTFQTFYSPEGIAGKLGENMSSKLLYYGKKIDLMKSLLTKNIKNKGNLKRRIFKSITKIKNTVNDLHKKAASFLTRNFKYILLPKFDVLNMTKRKLPTKIRNIGNKTVRNMLMLSHSKFLEYLKFKTDNLILVNEEYTSKTCGTCGYLNDELGSKKKFECSKCCYKNDRDLNAARNILLKYLTGFDAVP